jgi:hypothetical protein
MPDTLVDQLRARLHDVAATAPLEVDPPPDLERRVQRVRRRARRRGVLTGLSVAAALVAAVAAAAAIVDRVPPRGSVSVSSRVSAVADPVFSNAVMLDARGPYVVALDAGGHQRATLVTAKRGNVVDAQLTADRRTLWYLSVAGRAGVDCGEVVRADVRSGASHIVARAAAFAISPDGQRLALAGSCVPGVEVRNVASGAVVSVNLPADRVAPMRWSPDGSSVLARGCALACGPLVSFDASGSVRVVDKDGVAGAYAPNGVYVVRPDAIFVNDAPVVELHKRYVVAQVAPTPAGTFVVATPRDPAGPRALYRIQDGALVLVKTFDYGTLTPMP